MARTSRDRTVFPITVRELQVLEVGDVGPGMRRVVLGGPGLRAHRRSEVDIPALASPGFDDDVKIIVPDPVTGEEAVPEPLPDGRLDWDERSIGLARTYTIRRYDAEAGRLTVDFAQHIAGLASTWAKRVESGARVHVAGPKASSSLPAHTDWLLLAGDETALPAIARCLEELPEGFPVRAIVEVAERSHVIDLDTAADAQVEWVVRAEEGDLVQRVRDLDRWEGTPYVWVAGEAMRIKVLRRWFGDEWGVPKEHTEVIGYWRRREVVTVGADPATVDVGASGPRAAARIHETTELAPAFAVRAACDLELFARIDEGARDVGELARVVGLDAGLLLRLLRYLAVLEYVRITRDGSGVALAELGEELADPDSHLVRSLTGAAARSDLAFVGLLTGLRDGGPVVDAAGRTVPETLAADADLAADDAERLAREAGFTAPALPAVLGIEAGTRVVFRGPGVGVYADETVRQVPGAQVSVAAPGRELARCRAEASAARRGDITFVDTDVMDAADAGDPVGSAHGPPVGADVVVAVDLPATTPSDRLGPLVRRLADGANRLVLVTAVLDPKRPDEHELEDDLRRLCVHGAAVPTRADLHALAGEAGLAVDAVRPVGWGQHAVTLRAADGRG